MDSRDVPVVLIVFNRPEITRMTLESLKKVTPRNLLVVADGPRDDRPGDLELCAQVRALFDDVDWPCEVQRKFSDRNLGVEGNVELGLDWVFEQVPQAIVLEDDCRPDPTFFRYAAELLDRYRDDPRVWQIAGNRHFVPPERFGGDSYRFSTWASVWGWATWADRWHAHRATFVRQHGPNGKLPARLSPAVPAIGSLVLRSTRRHFLEAAESSDLLADGWDKHWWITIASADGLTATPRVNMVENVGFGDDATHTAGADHHAEPASAMPFPLRHPELTVRDVEIERDLELYLTRVGGRTAQLARRLIRSPRIRRVLRGVVSSKAATRVLRVVSKVSDRA